jgi:hypothetical protein
MGLLLLEVGGVYPELKEMTIGRVYKPLNTKISKDTKDI